MESLERLEALAVDGLAYLTIKRVNMAMGTNVSTISPLVADSGDSKMKGVFEDS